MSKKWYLHSSDNLQCFGTMTKLRRFVQENKEVSFSVHNSNYSLKFFEGNGFVQYSKTIKGV